MKVRQYVLFIPFLFIITGCGATICSKKDNSKHGVAFNYGNMYGNKYVDIDHLPTFVEKNKWVKKIIIETNGFLVISSQQTASCKNKEEIKAAINKKLSLPPCERIAMIKYPAHRYMTGQGYERWDHISEEEWPNINDLKHTFSQQADYHYENCNYNIFGRFYMFLAVLDFI